MKIATLAIVRRGNKVLLGRKKKGSELGEGTLNGPGGKFEPEKDKTIIDCVVRETMEEVDSKLLPAKLEKCAVITFHFSGEPSFEVHVYRTDYFEGEPHETDSMVPYWFDIDHLPFDRMLESDYTWFSRLIQGEKFCANVFYRDAGAKNFLNIEFLPFSE
jgi:8-oxo-dGTP pyrophosphatase MutT (NUDIX family)